MGEETTVINKREQLIDREDQGNPSLIIIHGQDIGRKFDLLKKENIIGRADGSEVQINEDDVSRVHAKIFIENERVTLKDENSTNGTFVNTKRIEEEILDDGDLILVGNTILKFIFSSSVESQYHESIYRLATLDGLTQVFNKKHLLEKGEAEFNRSRRYDRDLSLIIFDFDHFKKFNDQYGHPAGDFILQQTSAVIMKNMRKEDIFGRYGGEEFVIILPETKLDNAFRIADKLRLLLQTIDFDYQGTVLRVTISAGVAELNAATDSFQGLFKAADKALYKAKEQGRNRAVKA